MGKNLHLSVNSALSNLTTEVTLKTKKVYV